MSDDDKRGQESVEARLERVEASLARIEAHLLGDDKDSPETTESRRRPRWSDQGKKAKMPKGATGDERAEMNKGAPPEKKAARPQKKGKDKQRRSPGAAMETWLNRMGMGLLLVGLVFLYRLSEEMGLLIDPVRVGLGLGLGGVLGWLGWWLRERKRGLSRICLGGSLAAFYISLYAAYQLYELVPHSVAFGAMSVVTMGAFGMAHRWNAVTLSVVGALGGFATPLLLSTSSGNLAGLSIYNGLLVTGMMAIYVLRGWRHLLGLTAVGGWALGWLGAVIAVEHEVSTGAFAVWIGSLAVVWAAVGLIPVLRRWLLDVEPVDERVVGMVALLTPPALLGALRWAWLPEALGWWPLYAALAVGFAGLARWLSGRLDGDSALVGVHRLVVVGLVAMALVDIFDGLSLMAALAVEVALVHQAAKWLQCRWLRRMGHAGAAVVVLYLWQGVVQAGQWGSGVEPGATGDVADPMNDIFGASEALGMPWGDVVSMAVAVGGLYASSVGLGRSGRKFYLVLAHVHYLVVTMAVGYSFGETSYVVTAVWGLMAVVTLAWGVMRDVATMRWLGMSTVILVVLKLVLFDLSQADTLWRVAIFVGMGVALLMISYFSPQGDKKGKSLDNSRP